MKKYFARVWIVEVPGKNKSEYPSRIGETPNSSRTPGSVNASKIFKIFSLSYFEKSIHPNSI